MGVNGKGILSRLNLFVIIPRLAVYEFQNVWSNMYLVRPKRQEMDGQIL